MQMGVGMCRSLDKTPDISSCTTSYNFHSDKTWLTLTSLQVSASVEKLKDKWQLHVKVSKAQRLTPGF